MTPMYELWEIDTRNMIFASESEDAVLAVVREFLNEDGEQAAIGLVVLRDDRRGGAKEPVAADADLACYARTAYAELR